MKNSSIDIKLEAKKLGIDIDKISNELRQKIIAGLTDISQNTYNEAVRLAQQRLHETREMYLNALTQDRITTNDNFLYTIYLKPNSPANSYESGYTGFDIRHGFWHSPKMKLNKENEPYITIPLQHKPYSKDTGSSQVLNMREKILEIVKDKSNAKIKKVIKTKSNGEVVTTYYKGAEEKGFKNLVKIRDEATKSSKFFTFINVNQESAGWQHPGFRGIHVFEDLEKFVQENIDILLRSIK